MAKRMSLVNVLFLRMKKRPSNHMGLLLLYRYVSLGLTSFFFIVGMDSPLYFTLSVIVALIIAAWIITDIQKRNVDNHKMLAVSVCVETIGLTLLLLPTGGISSPFIWYALNPVLVAASLLTPLFCWGILIFYLGSATFIAQQLGAANQWPWMIEENSFFYLVCLLTTFLVRLFSGLTKELAIRATVLKSQQDELLQVNERLADMNEKYQETVEHIMSHYHLMDSFSVNKSPQLIIEEITHSLKKCTRSDAAFFWLSDLSHQNSHISATSAPDVIEAELKLKWKSVRGEKEPFIERLNGTLYGMKIIRTSYNIGILGVKINSFFPEAEKTFLQNRPFEFLSELSEIMLERLHMDQMMDQMIVIEEQNRIANEIHDSVSQRLFGIACSLHSLQVKGCHMTDDELIKEYKFLSQSANTTIKELRSTIFRLSSTKRGETPFLVRLKRYLDEYARLNDIRIDYQISGDEALIPDKVKQALYRIICEACGNAVRHGGCHRIELSLAIDFEKTKLRIEDNGIGYSAQLDEGIEEKGLGLYNIKSMVHSFAGTFSINGIQEAGTIMEVEIPNRNALIMEKVVGE